MAQIWRRWHRQWHGSVLASLRSTCSPVEDLVDRKQPVLCRVYSWIIARKRKRDSSRKQRITPPHIPVLCVGNVTLGGTGKTPFVQFLLAYFFKNAKETQVPLVLTRGYGDDEWRMLIKQFPACEMALGSDRVAVGAAKVKELGHKGTSLSCVVLDDGLQQWRLARDLEIMMVDALHPLGNGLLLPCGTLREMPRDAFTRADVVIIHHANFLEDGNVERLMEILRGLVHPSRRPIIATSWMKVIDLASASNLLSGGVNSSIAAGDKLSFNGRAVLVVCGVGNPKSVELVVKNFARWTRVEVQAFPDHHSFTQGDVNDILDRASKLQCNGSLVVVTTEKDFARSPNAMKILADKIDLRVLRCELELLHNCEQVKQRIDAIMKGPK